MSLWAALFMRATGHAQRFCGSYGKGDNSLRAAPSMSRAGLCGRLNRRWKICGECRDNQRAKSAFGFPSQNPPSNKSLNPRNAETFLSRNPAHHPAAKKRLRAEQFNQRNVRQLPALKACSKPDVGGSLMSQARTNVGRAMSGRLMSSTGSTELRGLLLRQHSIGVAPLRNKLSVNL